MAISKLTELAQEQSTANIKMMSGDSLRWMRKKIAELKNPSLIPDAIARERFRQTMAPTLGGLYCFSYDPKTKSDLPYWDAFPMVIMLDRYNDGFLGLNLHYLPYKYRVAFLDKLKGFASMGAAGEINRLRVTYDILAASKRLKEFRPCIKKYLIGHVQSKLLTIQPNEWQIAVSLPLQQFRGASSSKVWDDSLEEINKV
jgi:hypothetical protein